MAEISANGSKGHHKFTLNVFEEENTIGYTFTLSPIQTGWDWNWSGQPDKISYSITIGNNTYSGTIGKYDGSSTVTVSSASGIEAEDETLSISFSVTDTTGASYTCGNASASGTMTLTKIIGFLRIGIGGVWKKATAYLGVSGTWKKCKVYIGNNSEWKKGK